jgi:hypothetical protein
MDSIRYKKNVKTIENASKSIKNLRGVKYDLVDNTKKNELGLISEEVAKILPEIVSLDASGRPNEIDYKRITVVLIESIKDILIRIERLEKGV